MRGSLSLRSTLSCLALGLLTGCGSEGPTAPPAPPTVGGIWSYVAPSLLGDFLGSPLDCAYELEMDLVQSAMSFSGTYRNALLVCDLNGRTQPVDGGSGVVVNGTIEGNSVRFDIDAEDIQNTGTIDGDSMEGDVSIVLIVIVSPDTDTVVVRGRWSAVR